MNTHYTQVSQLNSRDHAKVILLAVSNMAIINTKEFNHRQFRSVNHVISYAINALCEVMDEEDAVYALYEEAASFIDWDYPSPDVDEILTHWRL